MWHLPAQLAGYNFPDNPIFGSFIISPIELIAVSFFLGWLTLKSGTFIPAAIAHGAGNSIQEGVISNINIHVPRIYEDLITLLTTVVIGLVFLYLINKAPKFDSLSEEGNKDERLN
jgi:membrane protease YdiL (CAAX protease family)